jgi:putative sigma-54 modulation protein
LEGIPMKVHYTGKLEKLSPALERKLTARFGKLGKLLDRKSEKEAHVILTSERHLHRAEITVNWYDRPLVGVESAKDSYTALVNAIDNLEKQILKLRARWRDTKRGSGARLKNAPLVEAAPPPSPEETGAQVFRVNNRAARKPMTVEEALLEFDERHDYLVYQDSDTDRTSVLVRRRDGNFDLIES